MAAPMAEDGGTSFCKNCKRDIAKHVFHLHEAHCHRHMKLCEKCKEPVAKSQMEEHMKSHELVLCKCNMEVEKIDLERHERDECNHRMMQCQFCEMSLKGVELEEHEYICGSRTETCDKCGNYILIRDVQKHDCSLIESKKTKNPIPSNGVSSEFMNGSTYHSVFDMNNLWALGYDVDSDMTGTINSQGAATFDSTTSFDSASLRNNAARRKDLRRIEPDHRGNGTDNDIIPAYIDSASSKHSSLPATSSGGASSQGVVSRPKAHRSRRVISKGYGAGANNDNVTDTFEGLNIDGASSSRMALNAKSTSLRQNGTERISKLTNRSNRVSKSRKHDNNLGIGIQGRLVDKVPPPAGDLDTAVCTDGGIVRSRQRNDRIKAKKNRPGDLTNRETDPSLNGAAGLRSIPIHIEDEADMCTSTEMRTDSQGSPEGQDNAVDDCSFEIPCEICEILVNVSDLEAHQKQCLFEQQQALQNFGNQMPEIQPDVVEKIIIDDDKPEDDAIIPCEFCGEVFSANDCVLHQPYCTENHERQTSMDQMQLPITNTNMPFSAPSRGFWESRVDVPPFLMQRSSFQHRVNANMYPEFYEEMGNDTSDVEDESSAFRSEQRQ